MMDFWKSCVVCLALALGSCTSISSARSADMLFRASSTSAVASQTSSDRNANQPTDDIAVRDVVRASFEIAADDLQDCLNADQKRSISILNPITISSSINRHVLTEYLPEIKTIIVSELTWRNFIYSDLSFRMIDMDVGTDLKWHTRYRLYLRTRSPHDQVESPARMAGLQPGLINKEAARELLGEIMQKAQYKVTFLLAHEYHHHLKPISKNDAKSSQLRQLHELEADAFAMQMLQCRSVKDQKLQVLLEAPLLFLDWVLLVQGHEKPLNLSTHPMDHRRMRNVSAFVISKLELLQPTSERLQLIGVYRELIAKADEIDRVGPDNFFATINAEARFVTRSSLLLTR